MAISRAFETVVYRLAATDMGAAFGFYQCVFDVITNKHSANPESIAEVTKVVSAADINIGGSSVVSLVRSLATSPAHLFPERTIRSDVGGFAVIRDASARRFAVKAKAEKLNRGRFVNNDWS
uniref:hypothetical protein n=1 Tax=Paracoccus sp. SSK6 TaxID=3143131 RepID=UPI00321C2E32